MKKILTLLLLIPFIFGCTDSENDAPIPSLTLSVSKQTASDVGAGNFALAIDQKALDFKIGVTSSTAWIYSVKTIPALALGEEQWFTLTQTDAGVDVAIPENKTIHPRVAIITIKTNSEIVLDRTVTVSQLSTEPSVVITPQSGSTYDQSLDAQIIDFNETVVTFNYATNIPEYTFKYTPADAMWITDFDFNPTQGTITFKTSANFLGKDFEADLEFVSTDPAISQKVKLIKKSSTDYFDISDVNGAISAELKKGYKTNMTAGTIKFDVSYNSPYKIALVDPATGVAPTWITKSVTTDPKTDYSVDKYTLNYTANTTTTRKCVVTLTSDDQQVPLPEVVWTLEQEAEVLGITLGRDYSADADNKINIEGTAIQNSTFATIVSNDVDWSVEAQAGQSWLTATKSTNSVILTASANTGLERSATITIKNKGVGIKSTTYTIKQLDSPTHITSDIFKSVIGIGTTSQPGNEPQKMFDGTLTGYWEINWGTGWDDPNTLYPHSFEVEFKSANTKIAGIGLQAPLDGGNPKGNGLFKSVQVSITNDGSTWTELGKFDYITPEEKNTTARQNEQVIKFTKTYDCQKIKVVFTDPWEGNNRNCNIGEMRFFRR